MPKIECGPDAEGKYFKLWIARLHKDTLDKAIFMVKEKNFDYIAVVAGLPGSGKSTLARVCAKYCDHKFDLPQVAFTADEFIKITNECPEYSSVVLDESFQSLNSKTTMSPDFLKIVNHLQIIRQKHLFIFLCLPNFFDLAKGIAIFRTSSLFVTYFTDNGDRGRFIAFGRNEKRKLYVLGNRFIDYNVVKGNYNTMFSQNRWLFDEDKYEGMKKKHLLEQEKEAQLKNKFNFDRDGIFFRLKTEFELTNEDIGDLFSLKPHSVGEIILKYKKRTGIKG